MNDQNWGFGVEFEMPACEVADGTGAFFVDWQVPISAIVAVAPTVTPTTPAQPRRASALTRRPSLMTRHRRSPAQPSPAQRSPGSWFEIVGELEDGSHTATITVSDPLGNFTVESVELTIDTSVAAASVTLDEESDDPTPTVSGTGEPGATVTVLIGGFTLTDVVDADGNWSVTVREELEPAVYPILVTVVDQAGNTESTVLSLTVVPAPPDDLAFGGSRLPATGLDPSRHLWLAGALFVMGHLLLVGERRLRRLTP